MSIWSNYKTAIIKNCSNPLDTMQSLSYWRDYLFANTIIYMLPLSLIALIPGIYVSLLQGLISIAIFDIVAVISLPLLALTPGLTVNVRKYIFCAVVYLLAFVLLNALGSFGPGLVYLLAISVFMVIIFPEKYAMAPVYLNVLFCIIYGFIIYSEIFEIHQSIANQVISWVAISTNLIFLSAVFSVLIPNLFKSLQNIINKQEQLQELLNEKNQELEKSLTLVKETNNDLEQFAYIASHDMQEPLRTITGFLYKIEERYNPLLDERGKKYMHIAVDGATRMKRIIQDLLEYSRTSRESLNIELIDVNEIVKDVVKLHQKIIEEKNATLTYRNLPVINSAKAPVLQLFANLVNNALKYAKADIAPVIEISCSETKTHWHFSVKDNGIGIAPEFHNKLFILFQRLHNSDEYSGTGIGLAICKKIAYRLGGDIKIESKENNGATFLFTIKKEINLKFENNSKL
jgi:signal transduction histidine kinase